MEVPRGFTRCDECGGHGSLTHPGASEREWLEGLRETPCPTCSGSGLVPTEKLREAVAMELHDNDPVYSPPYWVDCNEDHRKWYFAQADAVLRKVAEHIREER